VLIESAVIYLGDDGWVLTVLLAFWGFYTDHRQHNCCFGIAAQSQQTIPQPVANSLTCSQVSNVTTYAMKSILWRCVCTA